MSLFRRDTAPPPETWNDLREWRTRPLYLRYLASLRVLAPLVTLVLLVAGIAMYIAEPAWRTVRFMMIIWLIGLPVAAVGYMRRVNRMADKVPALDDLSDTNPDPVADKRA